MAAPAVGQRVGEESQRMVEALDKNGDGFIEREELRQLLFQLGISRDVTAIFSASDSDNDGLIRIDEFVDWLLEDAPAAACRQLKVHPNPNSRANTKPLDEAPDSTDEVINCSQWFAEALVEAGVTHVYGGHGGALVPMVNAVAGHQKLTWVCTRNEANASLMAAAHAKLTGGLACCMATSGPGATNLTTGLIEAELDQCAVICITGLKPRQGLGYSEFQDVNQSRLFAGGGIHFSSDVASPEAFAPILRNAMAKAITTHCCVHLAVPVDVQAAPCPIPYMPLSCMKMISQIRSLKPDPGQLDEVARVLLEAQHQDQGRILLAVGNRCVPSGPEILKLAEVLEAPVLTRLDAKGCVDESHPLVWGVMGVHGKPGLEASARFIESSELIVAFGVHDYSVLLCNQAGIQVRPLIQFEPDVVMPLNGGGACEALHTVVGYTPWAINAILKKLQALRREADKSPARFSKASYRRSFDARMGISPLAAQRKSLSEAGKNELEKTEIDYWELLRKARRRQSWEDLKRSKAFVQSGRFVVDVSHPYKHCHPAKVFEEMNKYFGPSDVLCVDTGDVTLWAGLCAVLTSGQRTLSSERLGTMGYSVCAGLAACLVREEHGRAVVVAGDGGVQMTLNELGTVCQVFHNSATEYRMLIVVFDNAMLGRVHFGFSGALGCELGPSPDFVALAKAYGGNGALLSEPEQIPSVIRQAFGASGLFLVHVLVDPSIKADMTAFKDKSIQMMASG